MAHERDKNPFSQQLFRAELVGVDRRGWEQVDYSEIEKVPLAFLQHVEQSIWRPDPADISLLAQQGYTIIPPHERKEMVPHMTVSRRYDNEWWKMELDLLSLRTDPIAEGFLKNDANPFYQQIAAVGVGETSMMMIRVPYSQLVDAKRNKTIVQARFRRDPTDTGRDVTTSLARINGARGEYLDIQHHTGLRIQFEMRPKEKKE